MNCKTALTEVYQKSTVEIHWYRMSGRYVSRAPLIPVRYKVVHKNLSGFFIRPHERDPGPLDGRLLSCMISKVPTPLV